MTDNANENLASVEVSRTIAAPPHAIFAVVANPTRHHEFDGSNMLRGALESRQIVAVGDTFTMTMHRLGRDYQMYNTVVDFEQDRRIVWEPAPGDLDTAGGDPTRIGVAAGYCWGYYLEALGENATLVTERFECGTTENQWILQQENGKWINGSSSVRTSMEASLERLALLCAP